MIYLNALIAPDFNEVRFKVTYPYTLVYSVGGTIIEEVY